MEVLQIRSEDTYEIRNKMLRPGLPIETCVFDGDKEELTFHLGAFSEGKLASVASFYFRNHPQIEDLYQYQLRGMATLPEHQGKGLSRALLETGFPMVKKNHVEVVWCNARVSACGFYEKIGFEKLSDVFQIEGVGPHYLMKLKL